MTFTNREPCHAASMWQLASSHTSEHHVIASADRNILIYYNQCQSNANRYVYYMHATASFLSPMRSITWRYGQKTSRLQLAESRYFADQTATRTLKIYHNKSWRRLVLLHASPWHANNTTYWVLPLIYKQTQKCTTFSVTVKHMPWWDTLCDFGWLTYGMLHIVLVHILWRERSFWSEIRCFLVGLSSMLYCLPQTKIITYFPLVPHICVSESRQHWFR